MSRDDTSESYTAFDGASASGMGPVDWDRWFKLDAGSGAGAWGIKVGTSSAAQDISHYSLQGVIDHGTGAGELFHGVSEETWNGTTGQTTSFKVARPFTNSSGGTITVEEMAWYSVGAGGTGVDACMIGRWLTGTLNVLNGESIKPSITYSVTTA